MEVFPDPTYLVLQVLPFAGVLGVLKFVILDPLLTHLVEREEKTTGTLDAVRNLHERTELARSQYEARVAAQRGEAAEVRAQEISKGQAQEAAILDAARQEAEASLVAFREKMAGEVEGVRGELQTRARGLAVDIASTVLGRPVTPAGGDS